MRICAIVNPAAGRGRAKRLWPDLGAQLREASTELAVCTTSGPGDATTLTRTALGEDYDRIVAVGGDGTLHEVVNGYFEPDGTAITPAPPLVPLACGTGTDFNRALGQKTGLDAVSYLHSDRVRPIDLLRIDYTTADGTQAHRYAINVTSFGLSSSVVRFMNRGSLSLPSPRLQYLSAILRALFRHRPFPVVLTVDGTSGDTGPVRLGAVANGPFFAAGLPIAPKAQVDDGLLDVTMVHDIAIPTLLRHVRRFYDGTHPSLEGVTTRQGRRVTARPRTDAPVWLEADGELLGQLPATVEVVPKALRVQY
jgi:diacylglycerol kinase (ATP)